MFMAARSFVTKALIPQRAHTELILKHLWLNNCGCEWDTVLSDHQVETNRNKNLFDVLDEKFGREIRSSNKLQIIWALDQCLQAMLAQADVYRDDYNNRFVSR